MPVVYKIATKEIHLWSHLATVNLFVIISGDNI